MKVSQEVIDDMRQEAQSQLAEPGHEDVIIANYDYNASVNSRDLIAVLDELEELRSKLARADARVEVAERERDAATMSLDSLIQGSDRAKDVELQLVKRQKERADAAEGKLAALAESYDAWKRHGDASTPFDLDAALRAARGEL